MRRIFRGSLFAVLVLACGSNAPQLWQVGTEKDWTQAAAGFQTTCGIRDQGHLFCWGRSDYGQVGGRAGNVKTPAPVAAELTFSSVARPQLGLCANDSSGAIQCWGMSSHGDLGADGGVGPSRPVSQAQPGNDWSGVSKGSEHTCAMRGGRVLCWGGNNSHELGDAFPFETTAPLEVPRVGAAQSVDVFSSHSCALASDGKLWCWGGGAALTADAGHAVDPAPMNDDVDWASYSSGVEFGAAVKKDGTLWQWGRFGRGLPEGVARVGAESDWGSVSAGELIACAIKQNGSLWCWGEDGDDQLLLGLAPHRAEPVEMKKGTTWLQVSCGTSHVCAVATDHSLWCWGSYQNGELGSPDAEKSHHSGSGHHDD